MKSVNITISYPLKEDKIKVASTLISFNHDKSAHDVIDYIRDKRIDKSLKYEIKTRGNILLKNLITLHNINGIQKRNKLLSMKGDINSGKDIFEFEDFPNVEIILSKEGEYVIFDGHHTILAYIMAGKQFLCEIPHILISGKEIDDKEFLIFFGKHKDKVPVNKWREYCVDWNASFEKQLEKKEQKTIGEVFEELNKSQSG